MKTRKIPMRMCVGCREMKEKRELLRIVKNAEGQISFDRVGKAPGRGAYICPQTDCLKKARKSRALERAFGVSIPDEIYEVLEQQMGADENG